MPFSRYLQSNERDHPLNEDDIDHQGFSTNVHFQLPNLIFNAPSVPPGGGAEALPAGLFPPASSLSWFSPNDAYNHPIATHLAYQHPSSASTSSGSPQSATSFSFPPVSSSYLHSDTNPPPFPPNLHLPVPSPLGLPIYSSSGFDLLSLLARVVSRPYPKIYLGPVDLSCAFVVTDTRRFDSPIVYASPSFLKLSGYDEHEVIGRNCRFLQAPSGHIQRGQDRAHTSAEAVTHMRKNIVADKECQVSIINYRKDGSAFINMVSVIPIRGGVHNNPEDADDITYHIGFQVDLTEQPKSILSKLKDGTYVVNYSDKPVAPQFLTSRDWRTSSMTMRGMSKDLRHLLSDSAFTASFQLSTSTHASTANALSNNPSEPVTLDPYDGNKPLHMFLLDRSPDFLHVVSLKGSFLYVAPAVRHVLGYDPDELVGKSLTDFCHPADCVPLMRELKEASATPGPLLLTTTHPSSSSTSSSTSAANLDSPAQSSPTSAPRPVDLLFRMLAKGRGYVWVECRGRLHVEPGKGRKAIILSGRLRNMPYLEWGPITRAGGLVSPSTRPPPTAVASVKSREEEQEDGWVEREFWGLLSSNATFLYVGAAVHDALGWGAGEVIGKPLADFVSGTSTQEVRMAIDVEMTKVLAEAPGRTESAGLACDMHTKEGNVIAVHIVLYRSRPPPPSPIPGAPGGVEAFGKGVNSAAQAPIVCQVKLCEGTSPPPVNPLVHPPTESVFDEIVLARGSSWQYELQQLKFRNQRLADEVAALESGLAKKIRRKQAGGLGPIATGRTASGSRININFAPPSHAAVVPPPSQSATLNVRFVSDTHGFPRPASQQSSSSHHTGPLPPTLPSVLPPPTASQRSPLHQQIPQLAIPPAPSPGPAPGYDAARADASMGAPLRMRHSTESSLQGWSSYNMGYGHTQLAGLGPSGSGTGVLPDRSVARAVSYNALPMKRSWDGSLRDSGGGAV